MPRQKKKPDHITQEDWDAVDSPPLTEKMLRNLRPTREVMPPHLFEKLVRAHEERQAQAAKEHEEVTLSVERGVVEHFQAGGGDWRGRMSAALRQVAQVKRDAT
ncbi:MAG: BrnA antitoxin family protein [Rhodomicrobium sp.]